MITAEEFFRSKIKEYFNIETEITLHKIPLDAELAMRWSNEYSTLKAKYYVTEALKIASENYKMKVKENIGELHENDDWMEVDKESILNAYPLENIK